MKITLTRNEYSPCGVFGTLNVDGAEFSTLEHNYFPPHKELGPKVQLGIYSCKRGIHHLGAHGEHKIESFEVTGIPGHSGIIFHTGNTQADSNGCILIGQRVGFGLTSSRISFKKFMECLQGVSEFTLIVTNGDIDG